MRNNVISCLIGVVGAGSVTFSMGAAANPPGVPVADPVPLSCTTVNSGGGGNNYLVQAMVGQNDEFPVAVQCPTDPSQMCADYGYMTTSLSGVTISHSLFAVSADQNLDSASPAPASVGNLGAGDSTTGFLKYTRHEYPIRFNSNATKVESHIYIKGISSARSSTAYIRGGKVDESCLIAGPGAPANPWAPSTVSKAVVAAGGKCAATLNYGPNGDVIGITLPPGSPCFAGKIPPGAKAVIGNEPIQYVNAPDGITFGNGTTTVYLPSGWAICTASPCPGTVTYKYY